MGMVWSFNWVYLGSLITIELATIAVIMTQPRIKTSMVVLISRFQFYRYIDKISISMDISVSQIFENLCRLILSCFTLESSYRYCY